MIAMRRALLAAFRASAPNERQTVTEAREDAASRVEQRDEVDATAFRHAFRQLASTVAVLTLIDRDGRPRAMTVTSMCGLTVEPPTLLVCIDRATRTHGDLIGTDWFGVDILAEDQHAIAARFARSGTDKVVPAEWLADPTPLGLPHLTGSVVRLGCTVDAIHPASTHDIVVGRIRSIEVDPQPKAPLLYHDGAFGQLGLERIPLALADRAARMDED